MVVYKPHGVGWLSCLSRWKGNAKARYGGISKECFSHVFFYVPTRTESITVVLTFNAEAGRVVGKENNMVTIAFLCKLPNGELIKESDIFSPFLIYRDRKNYNRFLLIPNSKQKDIKDNFIFVNSEDFRLCNRNCWNKFLPPGVCTTTQTSPKLLRIKYDAIYEDIREMIRNKLANLFEYDKGEEGIWQLKYKPTNTKQQ